MAVLEQGKIPFLRALVK